MSENLKLAAVNLRYIVHAFIRASWFALLRLLGFPVYVSKDDGEPTDSIFRHTAKLLVERYHRLLKRPFRPAVDGHWKGFKNLVAIAWSGRKARRELRRYQTAFHKAGLDTPEDIRRYVNLVKIGKAIERGDLT